MSIAPTSSRTSEHDERDSDDSEDADAAGRHRVHPLRQSVELVVGERRDPGVDLLLLDAQPRELLAHLLARERAVDGVEVAIALGGVERRQRADDLGRERTRRAEREHRQGEETDDELLPELAHDSLPPTTRMKFRCGS